MNFEHLALQAETQEEMLYIVIKELGVLLSGFDAQQSRLSEGVCQDRHCKDILSFLKTLRRV